MFKDKPSTTVTMISIWYVLLVLYIKISCIKSVACRASHLTELPYQTSYFFLLFSFVSLLSAAQHFAPADVCDFSCLL